MEKFSYLYSPNANYIDLLFERYRQDPDQLDESWRFFFEGMELGIEGGFESLLENASSGVMAGSVSPHSGGNLNWEGEVGVARLIQAYREFGKQLASINPLHAAPSQSPLLELSRFGLSEKNLNDTYHAGNLLGLRSVTLSQILAHLKSIYCGTVAFEFSHITDPAARKFLQDKIEQARGQLSPDAETRKWILKRLTQTEGFERFLHTRYVAAKRFSVEGGDNVVPMIDSLIETLAQHTCNQVVIGMAHRGRLNVLTHIMGKSAGAMFTEFEGTYKADLSHGEGDVKYHKGYSRDLTTRQGKPVHLSLAFNPSHLEFVNAVVEGMARAKQDLYSDTTRKSVVPVLIHGDAALAGQGVCYEVFNMAKLKGYTTGGTIHIVINNQVGFTTDPYDSRSTEYCTDLAKMTDVPVFHVNGDDADAVWWIASLAAEYRQKFASDVFIDLVCYRKHGHNEGDEPVFTQPVLYKKIKAHPSPREVYAQKLAAQSVLDATASQALVDEALQKFSEEQTRIKAKPEEPHVSTFEGAWKGFRQPQSEKDLFSPVKTAVDEKSLKELGEKIFTPPSGFHVFNKLNNINEPRLKSIREGMGLEWGTAEALAFASLVSEGHTVRITGQDAERGTFGHRHCVWNDSETGQKHSIFKSVEKSGARFEVHNSLLSETAVMGFEYGYAITAPKALTIWEAQFGDFANGAQVIIDQFIATSESKWQRMNGLVLLLPHGYEGQGPEHSSARLERFLQLCGKNNMAVANLSTAAQIFHALRRQVKRDFRKPLVIMSPKSLLRNKAAYSDLKELSGGSFQEVMDDSTALSNAKAIKRVLLCSGKVYYDLLNYKTQDKLTDVAIVRMEQLYPWPADRLAEILQNYSNAKEIFWVQEEPRNMGAWTFVFSHWMGALDHLASRIGGRGIQYSGRETASSPAVGSPKIHEQQLKDFLERAFK